MKRLIAMILCVVAGMQPLMVYAADTEASGASSAAAKPAPSYAPLSADELQALQSRAASTPSLSKQVGTGCQSVCDQTDPTTGQPVCHQVCDQPAAPAAADTSDQDAAAAAIVIILVCVAVAVAVAAAGSSSSSSGLIALMH